MSINIRLKIRSLIRRNQNFYCISYDWDSREIILHSSQDQYFNQLTRNERNGLVKRAEVYLDEPLVINNETYLIYMISFGDFRKGKMVKGQNPLSKGLGICLFDYVYIFVDHLIQAKKRMEKRIVEMQKNNEYFHRDLMLKNYFLYFQNRYDPTQFTQTSLTNQCKKDDSSQI